MKRVQELDGLRAVAILGVLVSHFAPSNSSYAQLFGLGRWGVDLFFAISGFLITGILLDMRGAETPFRTFYWRRVLRIFPPYYLALGLIAVLAMAQGEQIDLRELARHALFLSATTPGLVKIAIAHLFHPVPHVAVPSAIATYRGMEFKDCFGVYWSLSVEELFYLIWAPLVLKGSRKLVALGSVVPLLICPVMRGLAHTTPQIGESIGFLFRFDSLAAGACIALLFRRLDEDSKRKAIGRWMIAGLMVWFIGLVAVTSACGVWQGTDVRTTRMFSVLGFSCLAALCACIVGVCVRWSGRGGFPLPLLRSRPVIFLGTISYTMYLLHLPVYVATRLAIGKLGGMQLDSMGWMIAVGIGVLATIGTVVVAALSWRYMEFPILRWKDRLFPMRSIRHEKTVRQIGADRICV